MNPMYSTCLLIELELGLVVILICLRLLLLHLQLKWAERLVSVDNILTSNDILVDNTQDPKPKRHEAVVLPNTCVSQHQRSQSDQSWRMGFSYRTCGYIDQKELMSFAMRGVFLNNEKSASCSREIGPLKAWKQLSEANLLQ
ncbi:hypothetical protein VNO77_31529 [Canavalia gladiata]|uniref:Uncharacterized protein n=1 Tax=Canavalia gladiata TaxID=3824 RepID=A0AAN9Q1S9_CANGL